MKQITTFILLLFVSFAAVAQKMPAYKIYSAKGKKVSYKKMVKNLVKDDVILFGEQHNSALAHWLQLEVTKELHNKREIQLGAEMIEADNQDALYLYLMDSINQRGFDTLARLWSNHKTDYAPLVDFAKDNKLSFTACNIPRRYASMVYKGDFSSLDTLSAFEKSWIAPLPIAFDINLPTYQSILKMMGAHGSPKLVKAQAIKDATMAHFIIKNYAPGNLFIHFNGAFHSDFYEGILWYLKQQSPNLQYGTISTVVQSDTDKLDTEHRGKADFIIVVDEDMTTTY
ncbi:ChaN family lipoprotein [Bacteroidia bacterium]|nr:ChaN family lipoprotein [Bacteroidia bacterium]MDB9881543.1 ChaN family lipoprotein [Bacteroidia bacterium]